MPADTRLHVSTRVVSACLLTAALVLPVQAAQLHVPDQCSTIQAAIDAAVAGDEVILAPGIYTGEGNRDLDYHGKAITVRGSHPANPAVVAATVIDCRGSEDSPHRGFAFRSGEGPEAVLAGLTIENGFAPLEQTEGATNSFGGGIFINDADPTIRHCVIRNNRTGSCGPQDSGGPGGDGAGIYCAHSTLRLECCTITHNVAGTGQTHVEAVSSDEQDLGHQEGSGHGGSGGGIACVSSSLTIVRCTVTSNSAGNGGCSTGPQNSADFQGDGGHGGGIFAVESSLEIIDTMIGGNQAGDGKSVIYGTWDTHAGHGGDGGGIYCPTSFLTLTNCLIQGNSAGDGGWARGYGGDGGNGGGLSCGFADIANCLIAGNRAGHGGFGEYGGQPAGGHGGGVCAWGELTITGSTIVNNAAGKGGNAKEPSPGIGGSGGAIHAALLSMSHCIVAGNSAGDGGGADTTYSCVDSASGGHGGGVFCQAGALHYCLFANNAAGNGPDGDRIYSRRSSGGNGGNGGATCGGVSALNCTFANNRAGTAGNGYFGGVDGTPGTGDDMAGGSAIGCTFLATGGSAYDVGFADPDGPDNDASTWQNNNYHLVEGSPCINAGDPMYVPATGTTDLDGQPRLSYGRTDIGADEFLLAGDVDGSGVVNIGDLQLLVPVWGHARTGGSAWNASADLNTDGYVNIGDLQILVANWGRAMGGRYGFQVSLAQPEQHGPAARLRLSARTGLAAG